MSNTRASRLKRRTMANSCSSLARPSPICIFSATVSARLLELMTMVRSGETMPAPIWRTVSSSSEDTIRSSAPGTGKRLKTGLRPPSAASGSGWISR